MSYFEHNAQSVGLPVKIQPITSRQSRSEYTANQALRAMVRK